MAAYEFIEHSLPGRIFFVSDKRGWNDVLKKFGVPRTKYPATDAQMNHFDGDLPLFIVTVSKRAREYSPNQVIGLIVHELMHVVQHLEMLVYGDNSGVGDSRFDHETQAYLMQGLVMWMISVWAQSGRKTKENRNVQH